MKKLLSATALLMATSSLASAEGTLQLFNWGNYTSPELLAKFEKETGIDVTIDTFDSNEAMLAALKAGKMGQYDVAVPTDYMVAIMAGEVGKAIDEAAAALAARVVLADCAREAVQSGRWVGARLKG